MHSTVSADARLNSNKSGFRINAKDRQHYAVLTWKLLILQKLPQKKLTNIRPINLLHVEKQEVENVLDIVSDPERFSMSFEV